MQDTGATRDLMRTLKGHDMYLAEIRMHIEKDQDSLKLEIEDKMAVTQQVYSHNRRSAKSSRKFAREMTTSVLLRMTSIG